MDALSADPKQSAIPAIQKMGINDLVKALESRWFDGNPVSPDAIVDPVRAREYAEIVKRLKGYGTLTGVGKFMRAAQPVLGENETSADRYEVRYVKTMAPFILDMAKAVSDFHGFLEMQTPFYGILEKQAKAQVDFMLDLTLNLSRLRGQLRLDKDGKRLEYPHPYARMVDQLLGEVVKRLPARTSMVKSDLGYLKADAYSIHDLNQNLMKSGSVIEAFRSFGQLRAMEQIYSDYAKKYGDMFPAMREAADSIKALRERAKKDFHVGVHDKDLQSQLSDAEKSALQVARYGIYSTNGSSYSAVDPFSVVAGDKPLKWLKKFMSSLDKVFPSANIVWTDKIAEYDKLEDSPISDGNEKVNQWWKSLSKQSGIGAFMVPFRGAEFAVVPISRQLSKYRIAETSFHEMIHVMIRNGYFTSGELQTLVDEIGPNTEIFKTQPISFNYGKSGHAEESMTFYLGRELARIFSVSNMFAIEKMYPSKNEKYFTRTISDPLLQDHSIDEYRDTNVSESKDVAQIVDDIYSGRIGARGPRSGYSRPPEFTVAFKGEMDLALAAYQRNDKPQKVSPEASELAQVAMRGMDKAAESEIEWISDPDAPALDIDRGGDINPMDTQLEAEVWEDMARPDIVEHLGKTRAVRPNINKPGIMTVHPVGERGGIKYGKALSHYEGPLVLGNAKPAINRNAAEEVKAGRKTKHPLAAIVGVVQNRIPAGYKKGPEIKFNPKRETDRMRVGDSKGEQFKGADYVIQEGNKTYLCVKDPNNPRCF